MSTQTLEALYDEYQIATNDLVPYLSHLLSRKPDCVYLYNIDGGDILPLTTLVWGPFQYGMVDGIYILYGRDPTTGGRAMLRIQRTDVVEIINHQFTRWTAPHVGGLRICIQR